jgi:ribosomal protein L11 methyltransferase
VNAKKFEIGRGFAVFPFYDGTAGGVDAGERIPILIGHGKAFGSGEHETTASCLEELEAAPGIKGARVLDLGTGTGILAIAAVKLGAREVVAVDTEADAVAAASRNAALNGAGPSVRLIQGDITAVTGQRFDIVLANIYGDILVAIALGLTSLLGPGGRMILSGISYDYAYEVKKAYADAGLTLAKSRALENYVTLLWTRTPTGPFA